MYMHSGSWTSQETSERAVSWRGRSGHSYAMVEERMDSFSLTDNALFVLVADNIPCWVGTATDVIEDSSSRARFRAALKACSSVFKLDVSLLDDVKRVATAWDVENGHVAGNLKLVSAN